jgi:DNA-binding transcriptional LysR family regulator
MDTDLLRTFLEVKQTRHFAKAAQNLFVTQAAVSARIKTLETLVGRRLFTRNRNNIQLTVAGHQLVPYAETMLATWSRALMESAFYDEHRPLVVFGCLPSLREIYLDDWLMTVLAPPTNWLVQLESLTTLEILARLRERSIGVGLLYEPPRASDLWLDLLTTFELVLVSTDPDASLEAPLRDYVYVDWGSSFAAAHNTQLAGIALPRIKLDSPVLAHRLLKHHGGSAYLASPMVEQEMANGSLHRVAHAPVISRSVFLVGGRDSDDDPGIVQLCKALHSLVGT